MCTNYALPLSHSHTQVIWVAAVCFAWGYTLKASGSCTRCRILGLVGRFSLQCFPRGGQCQVLKAGRGDMDIARQVLWQHLPPSWGAGGRGNQIHKTIESRSATGSFWGMWLKMAVQIRGLGPPFSAEWGTRNQQQNNVFLKKHTKGASRLQRVFTDSSNLKAEDGIVPVSGENRQRKEGALEDSLWPFARNDCARLWGEFLST